MEDVNGEVKQKRFKIALSFPGEHRNFVGQVAKHLAEKIEQHHVLYDEYYVAEFARPNLDTHLQALYHDESELIAVFLCAEYEEKEWCGLEWRAIRDLIKKRQDSSIMPLRFDDKEILGSFSIDGYVWIEGQSPQNIADLILERYEINANVTLVANPTEETKTKLENAPNPMQHQKHIQFQNQIRTKIEEELSKKALKSLREGFVEGIWKKAGKEGNPSNTQLVNELFSIDPITQAVESEAMLEKLLCGTSECLKQLDAVGQSISENDLVWKAAKEMLGWLSTLIVRSEKFIGQDNSFDEIDMETLIGVEIYTARQKEIPATFRLDDRETNPNNFQGSNQIDHEYVPEVGWKTEDVTEQIWLIVWIATGGKVQTQPLSKVQLKTLNKRLMLHRTGSKRRNYYIAINKSDKHPLLLSDICEQIKDKLSELTIVHVGSKAEAGTLLLIGEGELVALIEEFLDLIKQYQ